MEEEERGEQMKSYSYSAPKVCPQCSGYGLLFRTMHVLDGSEAEQAPGQAPEPEKLPIYYPEKQIETVSMDTLDVWKSYCRKQAAALEGERKKFLGGIGQIEDEVRRRIAPKSANTDASANAGAGASASASASAAGA